MSGNHRIARFAPALLAAIASVGPSSASAVTSQFRGVNWADARDNFQSGVLYVSGLSSSDTYDSAFAVGNAVMSQFISKLGANAVRLPINEATVSQYWGTYTGAIDDYLDCSKTPTNYFEVYIRGVSSQLRSWSMGSFYWPGLRDGDWYSMTIKSGSSANTCAGRHPSLLRLRAEAPSAR